MSLKAGLAGLDPRVQAKLLEQGFEVGVHGLNHDGKLYQSRTEFKKRAQKINDYIKLWQAKGFRSPSMHHNLEWIKDLDIEYDASTFDTDPFEPQADGVGTIFPDYMCFAGQPGLEEYPVQHYRDFLEYVQKEYDGQYWHSLPKEVCQCVYAGASVRR